MSPEEQKLVDEYHQRERFLEPFKRITSEWQIVTQHKFQERLRKIDLVADGDLQSNWHVKLIASETGVLVGQFGFNEYGRYFDMKKVEYTGPLPVAQFFKWVESKIDKGQIRYSALAEKLGVGLEDPRVIHDLAYRIAKAPFFNYKRRRWYNKGKEASVNELYDQLQEAMQAIAINTTKEQFVS